MKYIFSRILALVLSHVVEIENEHNFICLQTEELGGTCTILSYLNTIREIDIYSLTHTCFLSFSSKCDIT